MWSWKVWRHFPFMFTQEPWQTLTWTFLTWHKLRAIEGFVHTCAFPPNLLYLRSHYQHLELDQIHKLTRWLFWTYKVSQIKTFQIILHKRHVSFLQSPFGQNGQIIIWAAIWIKQEGCWWFDNTEATNIIKQIEWRVHFGNIGQLWVNG